MRALVAKEIRLLLPAFGLALLLAVAPIWLLPVPPDEKPEAIAFYLFCFGAVMLALSSLGREFGLNTFSLMLGQPMTRARMWWTKMALVGSAIALVFGAWWVSAAMFVHRSPWGLSLPDGLFLTSIVVVLAILAGGLWTTLLVRQITAAFWFTVLVPAAIATAIAANRGSDKWILIALSAYSVLGFAAAWWEFSRAQEVGWTGGVIAFGRRKALSKRSEIRSRRAIMALALKELQLHQVALAWMGGLFLLQLGVMALRKAGGKAFGELVQVGFESLGLLWLFVPLLVGSQSVAEERKLGTMEGLRALPVSTRGQFAIKLFFVVMIGAVLTSVLFCGAEWIGTAFLVQGFANETILTVCLAFFPLSLFAFYASTLSRNIIQALVLAVVMTVVMALSIFICHVPSTGRTHLAPGIMAHIIGWPTIIGVTLWLAYRNIKQFSDDWRFRARNGIGLAGACIFMIASSAAVYHRAWELLMPIEEPHGPARLAGSGRAAIEGGGNEIEALLPDGRLWVGAIRYEPGAFITWGDSTLVEFGDKARPLGKSQPLEGSNWIASAMVYSELAALRSDGTLWLRDSPAPWNGARSRRATQGWSRYGQETNWAALARDWNSVSVFLLKTDGTLWRWGTNHLDSAKKWPGLQAFEPYGVGPNIQWARLSSRRYGPTYFWEKNGRAWALIRRGRSQIANREEVELARWPRFDGEHWQTLTPNRLVQAGVREDGSLWYFPQVQKGGIWVDDVPVQLGAGARWRSVASERSKLFGLKEDGTLWTWRVNYSSKRRGWEVEEPPDRLGINGDWLALDSSFNDCISLAADGSIWLWWTRDYSSDRLLAPSRKPTKIGSVVD